MSSQHAPSDRLVGWIVVAVLALHTAPLFVLRYLPMTDLPQHLAIASILEHLHDPLFGFSDYYAPADSRLVRTLAFAAQYRLVGALGVFLPLDLAMRVYVWLSALAIPLGVMVMLRALNKPAWLALLSLPLVYNAAFFWGLASFNLSIGVALATCGLLAGRRWGRRERLAVVLLSALLVTIHIYGPALLLGYVAIGLVLGDRKQGFERAPAVIPAILGLALWFEAGAPAPGFGQVISPGLGTRIAGLADAVLGGYRDATETWLLAGWLAVLGALSLGARVGAPAPRPRWTHPERVLGVYLLVNLALYLLLPQHTTTAKFVHFRHAVLAAVLLPCLVPVGWTRRRPRLSRSLVAALAVATVGNAWVHLVRFDREAGGFDRVVAALPDRPRLVTQIFARNGDVMKSIPYIHFGAYAQSRKGGLLLPTFPGIFWNLPVRLRADAGIPESPLSFEMRPKSFDHEAFGHFYDHLLTRTVPGGSPARPAGSDFPWELVYEDPPWRLYRSLSATGAAAESPAPDGS